MKKMVVKVNVHDEKQKQKALKCVSTLEGIDFLGMDMKDKKLTVTGDIDPVAVMNKLRKHYFAEIISVGAKEEPKKEEKKEEPKKEEPKKDEKKQIEELVKAYEAYNPCFTKYYFVPSIEDDPNSCSIC